ncbi:MAG: ATP-binding protein [Bacteroidetes bacterium]|nr:ATP-binding protein [Bacteroidota bacterium]
MENVSLFQDSHFVGYVSHVSPTYTRIHFPASNLLTKFYYNGVTLQAGLVGSYLLIEGENYGFLAQVIEIVLPEKERLGLTQASFESEHFHPIARVEILLGFDYYEPFKAQKGLNQLPPVGSKAYVCQTSILDRFLQEFGKDNAKNPTEPSFEIAQLPNDNNSSVKISPQALFSRHCAIVGTTGGGKSYTVAKILEEVSKNNGKAIVIDATGEYAPLAKLPNATYLKFNSGDTEEVCFHYSGLRETDLYALFRPSGQVQLPKLQEACKSLRLLKGISKDESIKQEVKVWRENENVIIKTGKARNDFLKIEKLYHREVNSPLCNFNIENLSYQIYYECITEGDKTNFGGRSDRDLGNCNSLISRINITLKTSFFVSAFGISKPDSCEKDIKSIISNFQLDTKQNILILSVENVTADNDLKSILVNAIGRHLYEKALSKDKPFKEKPLLLFVDEAHQFLNKKVKDEYSIETELNAFEKIAKECRKQGLFLVLATQMPRDIPVGVLSQFGTFIVHRLINQRDRETIEYACSEATKNALSFLPILAPGEAILAGVDFPMPVMLKIRKPNFTPDSDTPVLFKSSP